MMQGPVAHPLAVMVSVIPNPTPAEIEWPRFPTPLKPVEPPDPKVIVAAWEEDTNGSGAHTVNTTIQLLLSICAQQPV
jgi:hypothetical protein